MFCSLRYRNAAKGSAEVPTLVPKGPGTQPPAPAAGVYRAFILQRPRAPEAGDGLVVHNAPFPSAPASPLCSPLAPRSARGQTRTPEAGRASGASRLLSAGRSASARRVTHHPVRSQAERRGGRVRGPGRDRVPAGEEGRPLNFKKSQTQRSKGEPGCGGKFAQRSAGCRGFAHSSACGLPQCSGTERIPAALPRRSLPHTLSPSYSGLSGHTGHQMHRASPTLPCPSVHRVWPCTPGTAAALLLGATSGLWAVLPLPL